MTLITENRAEITLSCLFLIEPSFFIVFIMLALMFNFVSSISAELGCFCLGLLTEHHLEFPRLKGGCTGSSESTVTCQNATLFEIMCRGSYAGESQTTKVMTGGKRVYIRATTGENLSSGFRQSEFETSLFS